MKRILKYILIITVAGFLLIQLIPIDRTNPSVAADFDGPLEVKEILKRSCYDCHSNETEWPWYSYVAPASWLVSHDVKEGREELNFSEWDKYISKKTEIIEEIVEEVEEHEMPLPAYLVTHPKARISEKELSILRNWGGLPEGQQHQP